MKKKIIGILTCTLLIATTVLPVAGSINQVINSETKTDEELVCEGSLYWKDCIPSKEYFGEFQVCNNGPVGSVLCWEIGNVQGTDYPWWGKWTFTPQSGIINGPGCDTVNVSVVAPPHEYQTNKGNITVKNCQNPNETCTIPAILITPKNKPFNVNPFFLKFLEQHPYLFPVIRQILGI